MKTQMARKFETVINCGMAGIPLSLFLIFSGPASADDHANREAECVVEYHDEAGEITRSPASSEASKCTFMVHFIFKDGLEDRVFSCQIPAGESRCSTSISMSKNGKIGVPMSVQPLSYTPTGVAHLGCMYKNGYPYATVPGDSNEKISISHTYACAGK